MILAKDRWAVRHKTVGSLGRPTCFTGLPRSSLGGRAFPDGLVESKPQRAGLPSLSPRLSFNISPGHLQRPLAHNVHSTDTGPSTQAAEGEDLEHY